MPKKILNIKLETSVDEWHCLEVMAQEMGWFDAREFMEARLNNAVFVLVEDYKVSAEGPHPIVDDPAMDKMADDYPEDEVLNPKVKWSKKKIRAGRAMVRRFLKLWDAAQEKLRKETEARRKANKKAVEKYLRGEI